MHSLFKQTGTQPLPDVRQEGEGQEEPRHEAADVGEVVDPREQAKGEEEDGDGQQLGEGSPRSLKDLPALKQLHEQTGKDAKLAACRTHLRRNSREQVDDTEGSGIHSYSQQSFWGFYILYLGSVGQEDG